MFEIVQAKACELAKIFGGSCLSQDGFSNCKGHNSVRFKCQNEHNFYLTADQIQNSDLFKLDKRYRNATQNFVSFREAAKRGEKPFLPVDSMNYEDDSWCPKCVGVYNSARIISQSNDLRYLGGLYSPEIWLLCNKGSHLFSFPITRHTKMTHVSLCCQDCKKQERIDQKQRVQEEELQRDEYLRQKQKELFSKGRESYHKSFVSSQAKAELEINTKS